MKPLRFAIYAGVVWACASLLLVLISLVEGTTIAWIELDLRPLTGIALITADAIGRGSYFSVIISYAQNGMPITPVNVASSLFLGFADGLASGFLIALIYNIFTATGARRSLSALTFGAAMGIVFGLCSGILATVSVLYGLDLEKFDFSIRPLFLTFMLIPGLTGGEMLQALKQSYMLFPHHWAGVLAWTIWGFLDGFVGGAAGAYVYTKLMGMLRSSRAILP